MEDIHIIAGFSDIKSELWTKSKVSKSIKHLELWFTYEENILYAHDYDDHLKCIILAIYDPIDKLWRFFLREGSYGERLIIELCESTPTNLLVGEIYDLYKLYGFIPFYSS